MNIQSSSQTGAWNGRQRNRGPGPVGAVGNLAFNTEQGGTTRDTSIQARQSNRCAGILLYDQTPSAALNQRSLQETLSLVGTGPETRAFAMQDQLRVSSGSGLHARAQPELGQLRQGLVQARHAQDKLAAARALSELNVLVDRHRQAYGPLPEQMAEEVRKLVNDGVNLFRDAERNPQGPLNVISLKRLDDFTFVCLRQASSLHALGLELDLRAVSAVAHGRVAALNWQTVENMMDVLRTLSEEAVNVPMLIRQLRGVSGLELQRIQHLTDLGQFAGGGLDPAARRDMAKRTCELAINELFQDSRQAPIVHDAMRHLFLLVDLEGLFGKVAAGLESVLVQEDYRQGGAEIMTLLVTTRYLLTGMIDEMDQRLTGLLSGRGSWAADVGLYMDLIVRMVPGPAAAILLNEMNEQWTEMPYEVFAERLSARYKELESRASLSPDASAQSSVLYHALREQYGVAYDPLSVQAIVIATDSARAKMVPGLKMLPWTGPRVPLTVTLPVDGAEQEFSVDRSFYEDAFGRGNIALSVRGTGADGQAIRFTWPAHLLERERLHVMGEALVAFVRVARSAVEPLTRLMDIGKMKAVLKDALQKMGEESPFQLADRTIVQPEGDGYLMLDAVRNEDGSFRLAVTFRIYDIHDVKGVRPDGTGVTVYMNPRSANWAEVRFILHASPDAQWIDVVGLPQFRHRFDVKDIVEDPLRRRASPVVQGGAGARKEGA